MKKLFAMSLAALAFGTIGCTTLSSWSPLSDSPEDKYKADQPPPIQKNGVGYSEIPKSRVKISDSRHRVTPEEINSENYLEQARRLQNSLTDEGRAMSKVGR